ncbi:hypothetical protein Nepgr_030452 [Nepenthes gracilis]|uniref:Uncharacterized protein n=1 Tax=Nepenthes gracilis TaxID=150966 RepID=A0AAD3TGB5_NEPGR|nr:hypothetical protein Nepgr_030452 [Nepenthes gracilis]
MFLTFYHSSLEKLGARVWWRWCQKIEFAIDLLSGRLQNLMFLTFYHSSLEKLGARVWWRWAKSREDMNWVQRKIYLYNVTFGLYMLDWWERYLFNTLIIVLVWFIFYNGSRYITEFCKRHIWPSP